MDSLNNNQFLGNSNTDEKVRWSLHFKAWCDILRVSYMYVSMYVNSELTHYITSKSLSFKLWALDTH